MTKLALEHLCDYILSLNLSRKNREWLANKIVNAGDDSAESETQYLLSSQAMVDVLEQGKKDIEDNKGVTVEIEDLWK